MNVISRGKDMDKLRVIFLKLVTIFVLTKLKKKLYAGELQNALWI